MEDDLPNGGPPDLKQHDEAVCQSNESTALDEHREPRMGKYVIICTIIATVSSTLLGYDGGVMSGAILFAKESLNLGTVEEEMVMGSLALVSIVGGAISGRLSDAIGRKKTMTIAAGLFFVGAVVMACAPSFAVLMLGRVVAGLGVGFALMIAPVYSAELSPARVRGSLVSLSEVFISFGVLLGYIVSFTLQGLPTHLNWRLMLGLGALPAVFLACGVLVMPESPRWLVTQKRMAEAREILIKTSDGDKGEANLRLREVMEAAGVYHLDPAANPTAEEYEEAFGTAKRQGQGVWREILFPSPAVQRMLIISLGMHFFQQACGIDAVVYYSPVVFREAGVTSKIGQLGALVGVGFCKFIFIFVATFYLDRVGRKPLMLISSSGVTLCLIVVSVSFMFLGRNSAAGDTLLSANIKHAGRAPGAAAVVTILATCAFVGFFSVGLGPISWVFISEIFPLRLRAQAVGLGVAMNRLMSGTIGLTFLSISKSITPAGTFFLFAGVGAVSVVFFSVLMPETKGKTLEELAIFFERKKRCDETAGNQNLGEKSEACDHAIEMGRATNEGN